MHGQGVFIYGNGDKYVGSYKDNQANGYGTYTWKKGHIYIGNWKNGNRHGFGKMLYSDGYVQEGNWVNDILTTDNNSIAKYIKRKFYFVKLL